MSIRSMSCTAGVLFLATGAVHAQTNLLTNPSFENGLSGWTVVTPNVVVESYGTSNVPSNTVAAVIGGGDRLLRANSGDAIVEQAIALAPSGGAFLRLGGYLGGVGDDDSVRLVARFLDGGGAEVAFKPSPWLTPAMRNDESVLMLREGIVTIPAAAASAIVRVEFDDTSCCAGEAAVDGLFAYQVDTGAVPPPFAIGAELVVNGRFEDGWTGGSPLVLDDAHSWVGAPGGPLLVKAYSDADPTTPSALVSCAVGGGMPTTSCEFGGAGNLLTHSGAARIEQRIDVRGNAADFNTGDVALSVSALLGGMSTSDDTGRIDVTFYDAQLNTIAPVATVGPVTRLMRNSETVVVRREDSYVVPSDTAFIDIAVAFADNGGAFGSFGLVDNVSATLEVVPPVTPVPLYTDLVTNGGFEAGTLPGSPLELDNATGWEGALSGSLQVVNYGGSSSVPSAVDAALNGWGGQVLTHTSTSQLRRRFDVESSAALVDAGRLRVFASAFLGGATTSGDNARVEITFLGENGGQVPGAGGFFVLGPVTAADRGNITTLLERTADVEVPFATRSVDVVLQFDDLGGPFGSFALADEIEFVVYDTLLGGPSKYPGTDEGLRLFSGVNGPPTSGPGNDVESAVALDVLSLRVESIDGALDYAPLVLGANLFPTGFPPAPSGIPGLVLDPFLLIPILDGFGCSGFGCALVLPGGTNVNVLIPPNLGGNTVWIQAFALNGGVNPPANGLFASTDAHEIEIQ